MIFSAHMHHIQKTILITLARSPAALRFSQLQPSNVPNNSFSYHLKRLVEQGYVEQITSEGYVATRKALKIIHNIDSKWRHGKPHVLTALYVTNDNDEVLLIRRSNHPFKNLLGIPSGNLQAGESLKEAAIRELFEKTSVDVSTDQLEPKGVLDFRYIERGSGDLFLHGLSFVFAYRYLGDPMALEERETAHGMLSWSNLAKNDASLLPEVQVIADLVARDDRMITSIDFEEPIPV
jgi:ADP-ribose pyrophosphatase YjhB (NUDIX family)